MSDFETLQSPAVWGVRSICLLSVELIHEVDLWFDGDNAAFVAHRQ